MRYDSLTNSMKRPNRRHTQAGLGRAVNVTQSCARDFWELNSQYVVMKIILLQVSLSVVGHVSRLKLAEMLKRARVEVMRR